jgi:hypothetical protein
VSTTVAPTCAASGSSVEAAAMEASARRSAASADEAIAVDPRATALHCHRSTRYWSAAGESIVTNHRSATIPAATVVAATTIAVPVASIEAIPGAGSDEEAPYEPARAVVAVRGAGVWRIRVVSVRADRWTRRVSWANTHSDRYLGVRRGRCRKSNA